MAPLLSPRSLGAENGLFQPIWTLAQKNSKLTPEPGHTRAGAQHPTPNTSSRNPLEALCYLVPSDSQASWRHGVATWGQDAQVGKISHLELPTRVGFRGDLVKPSFDSRALTSPLVPCIGVWLAVTLAACCSRRGGSSVGAENSKKGKIGQPGTHRMLPNSG